MPIPCLVPGVLSGLPQQVASYVRAAGTGLPDNFTPGETVAEMFGWITDQPIFGLVIIPSDCIIYDSYGFYDTDEISYYEPATVPGALRLDDIHEDSMVLIINYGAIYGQGGSGGMGYVSVYATAHDKIYTWIGGGGGAGQSYTLAKGGMEGAGYTVSGNMWKLYQPPYGDEGADEEEPGTDWEEGGDTGGGGAGTNFSKNWSAENSITLGVTLYPPEEVPHPYDPDVAYQGWIGWPHMGPAKTTEWDPYMDTVELIGWSLPTPGYSDSPKAAFGAQDGTAAIVCGCDTWIFNSVADTAKIFGGGGGGVGGDYGAHVDGKDGGAWGADGAGPTNYFGKTSGAGGYAVRYNGNEVTFIEGEGGTQVKGLTA